MPKDIILCVDDEPTVVRACCMAIVHAGFRCLVAENATAGLDVFLELRDEICLVIADVIMPGPSGVEMADSILRADPQMKILLMSGYSDQVIQHHGRDRFPFIHKPFIHLVLINKIRSVLGLQAAPQS